MSSSKARGDDIRDPKLAVIGGRLFLYALENRDFKAEPYRTVFSSSADGAAWDEFPSLPGLDGWLLWRTLEVKGEAYATAYWWEHGRAVLLRSPDGVRWSIVSTINEGERNDETEAVLLPDGAFGDPRGSTLICESLPPYDSWKQLAESRVTRLDGPALFTWGGRTFSDGLVRITDFPSSGAPPNGGVVVEGDSAWATYYSSPPAKDWAWILGMFSPTAVRIAKIDLKAAAAKAAAIAAR